MSERFIAFVKRAYVGWLVLLGVVAAFIGLAALGGAFGSPPTNREAADVELVSCTWDTSGTHAALRVTNQSSKKSDYSIRIVFRDEGGDRVGEDTGRLVLVEPGKARRYVISTRHQADRCDIADVNRSETPRTGADFIEESGGG